MNRLLGVVVALAVIAAAIGATTDTLASGNSGPRHWAACQPGYRLSPAEGVCLPRGLVKR